jgi:hypothetical protein
MEIINILKIKRINLNKINLLILNYLYFNEKIKLEKNFPTPFL